MSNNRSTKILAAAAVSALLSGSVSADAPSTRRGANAQPRDALTAAGPCAVSIDRELLIRDVSVVEDPIRTSSTGPEDDPRVGVWTFAHLMEQMAPTTAEAPTMVEHLFRTWLQDQNVNDFSVAARPQMQTLVLDSWPRSEDGALDLKRAPLRLLALTNRIDLRRLTLGRAGEGRFVFGVLDGNGRSTQFTIIIEYRLPATTTNDVLRWANAWHALGSLSGEEYNAALQAITERFAGRDAELGRVNGSALGQLRTNEIALAPTWELRQFELSAETGLLEPTPVTLTPDSSFIRGSAVTADFINQNEADILLEQHDVPSRFQDAPFLAGSSINRLQFWDAPGIANNEARHKFSLNTCNGCHGRETNTTFLHILPRGPGARAPLSGFLNGGPVTDPVSGEVRNFNDLERRKLDLERIVCAPSASQSPGSEQNRTDFLSEGIHRVH